MLILNEKKYAKDIYEAKDDSVKSVVAKVGYVTRYHLYEFGYDDKDNYGKTVEWMYVHHANFDESCYSKLIADAIKKAHKRPFFELEKIVITKSELEIISSLENLRAEKILFVLLCMAKQQRAIYGFTNGLVRYSLPDLCKMARISVPTGEREYILYEIIQRGYLSYPKKNDTSCLLVNFIDNVNEGVMLTIDSMDCNELAYVYLNWKNNGAGYGRCELCGKLMRQSKKDPNRFCRECSEVVGNVPDGMKVIRCADCGQIVYVSVLNSKTCRCEHCQDMADKQLSRDRQRRWYESHEKPNASL